MAIDSLMVWCQSQRNFPLLMFNAPFLQPIGFRNTLVAQANSSSLGQQKQSNRLTIPFTRGSDKKKMMLKSCQVLIYLICLLIEAISNFIPGGILWLILDAYPPAMANPRLPWGKRVNLQMWKTHRETRLDIPVQLDHFWLGQKGTSNC